MARSLPDQFFADPFRTFLSNILSDRELCPEIRNNSLTIYYRGAALIRDLRIQDGKIAGDIHYKYIPVRRPPRSAYVPLQFGASGISFSEDLQPLSLGLGEPDALSEYKRTMKSVSHSLECQIIHEIVRRSENCVLDQEIKFQVSGEPEADKIDICHYDSRWKCLSFVEVKGIHDPRLNPGSDDIPEVIHQLRRYGSRIQRHRDEILKDYQQVTMLKRQLGLGERIQAVPETDPKSIFKKPVLVIGHCTRNDVAAMLSGRQEWSCLIENLKETAAGLILCGKNGCRLDLEAGGQGDVFDTSLA